MPEPDEAMSRIASSRDDILAQSNHFLIAGMVSAVLYGVKILGLRIDLVLFDAKIFELPYGLFVFCVVGSGSFLIAQSRFIDAHALDVRLRSFAEAIPRYSEEYYQTFPSKNSWLETTREQFFSRDLSSSGVSNTLFSLVGFTLLAIYFLPVFACAHFLWNWEELADEKVTTVQWWIVLICFLLDLLFFLFVQRVYALGRDKGRQG